MPTVPLAVNLGNNGSPVVSRDILFRDLAIRAWGSEYNAPDRGAYEWSNGRKFDSTDRGATGIYNAFLGNEQLTPADWRYPDMYRGSLLTENGDRINVSQATVPVIHILENQT